jgi:hypothetical protein
MPDIAPQVVQPRDRARVAVAIFCERHAADRATRGERGLLRAHAPAPVFVFEQRKMSLDLAREIIFGHLRADGTEQTKQEASHRVH